MVSFRYGEHYYENGTSDIVSLEKGGEMNNKRKFSMTMVRMINFMLETLKGRAKRSNLARRIFYSLGMEMFYNLGALTEKAALHTTINTTSLELFDWQGEELANELKLRMPRDSVVCDFGCGIGRPEKFLAPYCKEIHGVDISRGMLRLARRRHRDIPNVHFHKNNGRDLFMFRDCTFDFAFSEAVLQHNDKERIVSLLIELFRILKPKGKVYLQFCNLLCRYNLDCFIEGSKDKILTPVRIRYWLPKEVEIIIKAVGFELINLEVKSDFHGENRECLADNYHRDYSIWVFASKP